MEFLRSLFDTTGFPPRWRCGTWSAFDGWLHIIADILIFIAYSAIPAGLAVILARRRDVPFPRILLLFVTFILSCGLTHLLDATMFYHPMYRLLGVVKAVTAVVSLATAIVLISALPEVLRLPSVQKANRELSGAVARERELRAQLEQTRAEMEARSAQLTLKHRRLAGALEGANVVACQWSATTGVVEWEVGFLTVARRLGLETQTLRSWEELLGAAGAEALRRASVLASESGRMIDFEHSIEGSPGLRFRISAMPEPEVKGEPSTMTGMFRLI